MIEYFKDKKGFWWILLYEVLLMFSNKPSFFASKRMERFVMFWVAMWIIVGFTIRKWSELNYEAVLAIAGFLLGFGAWNAVQLRKDQKQNAEIYKEVINEGDNSNPNK